MTYPNYTTISYQALPFNADTQTTASGQNCSAYVYPQNNAVYAGWTTPRYAVDYIQVTADNLNFRTEPGEQYRILGKVVNGHYYVLLETNGPWGKIRTVDLSEGWVYLPRYATAYLGPNMVTEIANEGELWFNASGDWWTSLSQALANCGFVLAFEVPTIVEAPPVYFLYQIIGLDRADECLEEALDTFGVTDWLMPMP